jgi:hypothetical protein
MQNDYCRAGMSPERTLLRRNKMNRRSAIYFSAIMALGLALLPGNAISEQKSLKEQLVGTWILASWEQTLPDGSKFHRFGSDPKGVNAYDASGHFSLIMMRPDLPKLASGDASKVTPDEAQKIATGTIAYYGTYTVNEADKTVSLKLDATMLVNQLGIEQKRLITSIDADEMRYQNPTAVGGGQIVYVWKRAR